MTAHQSGHFRNPDAAHDYARRQAQLTGVRWWVGRRVRRWYALPPELATRARGNPAWPGTNLKGTR